MKTLRLSPVLLALACAPLASAQTAAPTITGSLDELVGQQLSHFNLLALIIGYLAVTLIGLFGFLILWRIFRGDIDISLLISESDGTASLSRFQFLIFTFVIALSLMLVILGHKGGPDFPPTIPVGIYALLGISAASYVVSKGIQAGADKEKQNDFRVSPDNENAG